MAALTRPFRRRLLRRRGAADAGSQRSERKPAESPLPEQAPVEIAPNDPLLAYFQTASEAVDIDTLELDSPALRELKAAGVKLAVPLVSQGELIGVLNLGPRLSEQDYSSDDRKLLDKLAAQAAPALRVAQLVREQKAEAATRQRFEQELEVARLIQQNFLPRELPDLPGWQIAAYYPERDMFGFPRLKETMADAAGGQELIDRVLGDLEAFTGPGAEQEDDITMVTLQRSGGQGHMSASSNGSILTDFDLPSEPGN